MIPLDVTTLKLVRIINSILTVSGFGFFFSAGFGRFGLAKSRLNVA